MLAALFLVPLVAQAASAPALAPGQWPACAATYLGNSGGRYADDTYRNLVLGPALTQAPAQGLFRVAADAAQRGEGYKALYFARLVTRAVPDNAAAWRNRAALAERLGLSSEAAASTARSENPASGAEPAPSVLPGKAFPVRPASVADYAAFANLMADDSAASLGHPVLVAANDNASGINVATAEEVEARRHVFAQAKPLTLVDIPNNAVVLGDADPMGKKVDVGSIAFGILAVAGAGYAMNQGMTYAVDTTQIVTALGAAAGEQFKQAANTPSKFSGGSFVVQRLGEDGAWKEEKRQPQTTGEIDVVGMPMPLLWSSGGSTQAQVEGELSFKAVIKDDIDAVKSGKGTPEEAKPVARKVSGLVVSIPRIDTLCTEGMFGLDCKPGAANEFMLRGEDIAALYADAAASAGIIEKLASVGAQELETKFAANPAAVSVTPGRRPFGVEAARRQLVAFDASGTCYAVNIAPDQWVGSTPPPKKRR